MHILMYCEIVEVVISCCLTTLASNPGFPSSSAIFRAVSEGKLEGKLWFKATMTLGLGIVGVCWYCCWFPHYLPWMVLHEKA